MSDWLPGASVHDLHPAIGNGPFGDCYGVVLHVNVDERGTPDSFWGNGNPGQVCPNFQVYKDGSIHQMLPMNWQPWCQVNGNFHFAAIETAGLPSEPLTDAQVNACAKILAAYHRQLGVPLQTTDSPTGRGLACHSTGGGDWGGHACPGDLRAKQRALIVARAKALLATPHPSPTPDPKGPTVARTLSDEDIAAIWAYSIDRKDYDGTGGKHSAWWRLIDGELNARAAAAERAMTPKKRA